MAKNGSRPKARARDLKIGERFQLFGHTYRVVRVGVLHVEVINESDCCKTTIRVGTLVDRLPPDDEEPPPRPDGLNQLMEEWGG